MIPAVSVILPVFNGERFLSQAIASAINQTFPDLEIIVVDDGSTDTTRAIAGGFGSRVRYVRQANQGVAAARNTGLAMARGTYVAFLDTDDVLLDKTFARARWTEHTALRRLAHANMYMMLAGSYWHASDPRNAIRGGVVRLGWNPRSCARPFGVLRRRIRVALSRSSANAHRRDRAARGPSRP